MTTGRDFLRFGGLAAAGALTHVKTNVRPNGKEVEPMNVKKVVEILSAIGYRGYLTL